MLITNFHRITGTLILEDCSDSFFYYVSLTVYLSVTLANDQLDAQIPNTFITILYMCMFRAIYCSSSGGQIILIQHLLSSLSVSDRPVHRRSLTESDDTRCCVNTI
jgi:prenyltransferase beta subunit